MSFYWTGQLTVRRLIFDAAPEVQGRIPFGMTDFTGAQIAPSLTSSTPDNGQPYKSHESMTLRDHQKEARIDLTELPGNLLRMLGIEAIRNTSLTAAC
jgi:hypothetical protein